ncbi:hypothetical protein DW989_12780 [Bacteroides stercoris]|nr:hypothetical protein DW989_12780 [Bacteroides stercoris]
MFHNITTRTIAQRIKPKYILFPPYIKFVLATNLFKYHIQTETGKVIFYAPRYKFHCIRVTAVIAADKSSEITAITPFVETIL